MASLQTKHTSIVGISCLLLLLLALGIQPLEARIDVSCPPAKRSWPELVGVPGCKAAAHIKKQNPTLRPIVIPRGAFVPLNYVCNRVYVRIQGHLGLVSSIPRVG